MELNGNECAHQNFRVDAKVARILEHVGVDRPRFFNLEVQVQCLDCALPFAFTGLPNAISVEEPCLSIDSRTLSVPINPDTNPMLATRMTIHMPAPAKDRD